MTRADGKVGKRSVRMKGEEFVRRFMQHILPTGLKRTRHYGVLASACKGERLALARAVKATPCAWTVLMRRALANDDLSGNAMAGALATRLFGAEARRAARLRRTRRQTRMFEAQPSLRVCLAARAPQGSRSAA